MQMLTCIQVLFNATTTTSTMYAILDLILLNADTYVSAHPRDEYLHCIVNKHQLD
jgi:hypothetical protein